MTTVPYSFDRTVAIRVARLIPALFALFVRDASSANGSTAPSASRPTASRIRSEEGDRTGLHYDPRASELRKRRC